MNRRMFFQAVAVGSVLLVLAALAAVALGSPANGVTPTVLARGTYDSFKVRSYPQGPGDFKAEAKEPTDIVVRRHVYAAGSSTGWHTHPGPVFITVVEGELTFYEYDDPTCTPDRQARRRGVRRHRSRAHRPQRDARSPQAT